MTGRRLVLTLLVLVTLVAATVLGLWGTRWTVPRAGSSSAGYMLAAAWDGRGMPGGALERPIGIAAARSGDVYVTDARRRVVRFSTAGEFLGQWGREGDGASEFRNPVGVAVGRDETVYVSDYEQDRVQTFTATGEFIGAFGRSGSGPAELNAPAGLTSDDAGSVYVADFYNHRVQKWRRHGSFDRAIGHAGRLGGGALHYPTGVALTPRGELLVADAYNHQLQWFTADGQFHRRVGYHLFWIWPRPASSRAGFFVPTDAAVGPDGVVHVADSGNHRVVMLSARGAYLAEWRIPDADPKIFSPEQIAISPDGATVYATDLAKSRVLVLRIVEKA